jgi:hypothetical protein
MEYIFNTDVVKERLYLQCSKKNLERKSAFDLLKNKGLDMTTLVVLCLILKLFLRHDKLGGT